MAAERKTALRKGLAGEGRFVGDGATGTRLQAMGLPIDTMPERWVRDRPDAVREVAATYARAGADLVRTNTFGANPIRMAVGGLDADPARLNAEAVRLAREGAGEGVVVLGAMGPIGVKEAEPDAVRAAYAAQVAGLVGEGVDGLIVETMVSVEEATAAVEAAKQASDLPVIVSFVWRVEGSCVLTLDGADAELVAREMSDLDVAAIGVNCVETDAARRAVVALREAADGGVTAFPNAGLPRLEEGRAVYHTDPEGLAREAARLFASGACLVGGCCGTDEAYVEALAEERRPLDPL